MKEIPMINAGSLSWPVCYEKLHIGELSATQYTSLALLLIRWGGVPVVCNVTSYPDHDATPLYGHIPVIQSMCVEDLGVSPTTQVLISS
jgi:hypothetical protein